MTRKASNAMDMHLEFGEQGRRSFKNSINNLDNEMNLEFGEQGRRSFKNGIDILANVVKTTLGPKGRNLTLDKKDGNPTVTNNGVTVAKAIQLKDPFENIGAQLLKEV